MTDDEREQRRRGSSPTVPPDWAESAAGQRVLKRVLAKAHGRDALPVNAAQSFDAIAEVYDRFAELTGEPFQRWLRSVLPHQGGQALDLGCGAGRHTVLLAERFEEVVAVDISAPMLALARAKRSRPNVVYVEADLLHVTPERDGPFDLILSVHTLHHVADLNTALRHIRRLVAPGGTVILADLVANRPSLPRWRFYLDAWRQLPADLMNRSPREALELYGLRTHSAWLNHVTSDRFLSPEAFERYYGAVFEAATFVSLDRGRIKVLWWQAGECGIRAVSR
jgi:ubiquinone/menaquinone biosynthesis C-methylase UbiE